MVALREDDSDKPVSVTNTDGEDVEVKWKSNESPSPVGSNELAFHGGDCSCSPIGSREGDNSN